MGKHVLVNKPKPEAGVHIGDRHNLRIGPVAAGIGIVAFLWACRSDSNPQQLGAVQPEQEISVDDVLRYANITIADTNKRFAGDSLGFVTPWNSAGYEFAKKFASKFSMISPVWYQIAPGNVLTGSHHYDEVWLEHLHSNHVRIVPRFNLEGWQWQDIVHLLQDPRPFVDVIANEVNKRGYDGIVLEATQVMLYADHLAANSRDRHIPSFAESVIAGLDARFRPQKKQILVVVSPDPNVSKINEMVAYSKYASHLVVMTYDFGSDGRVGPNAPFNWVRKTLAKILGLPGIKPEQVLLGLNFYGMDHSGRINEPRSQASRAVVADEVIQILSSPDNKSKSVSFLTPDKEHLLSYVDVNGEEHSVFYPTPKSIQQRVRLAENLGVGIQIWELGQGFECFFDML